jgi:uncharacterized protein YfcZ (UPF0381/DUF406 family)
VKEIIQILKKHFHIHKESIQQIQELETKTMKLTAENEDMYMKIKQLVNENNEFRSMMEELIKRNKDIESATNELAADLEQMKLDKKLHDNFIIANEIASLYIHYYIKPVFSRELGQSWDKFTTKLSEIEQELDTYNKKCIEQAKSPEYDDLYKYLIRYLEPLQTHIPLVKSSELEI